MPKICYVTKRFHTNSKLIIVQANQIIEEYQQQGFELTLRQLYYQFVARDLFANTASNYEKLSSIVNNARLELVILIGQL